MRYRLTVGQVVKHSFYPRLRGRVIKADRQPWPYTVKWDDLKKAEALLGLYCTYPDPADLEPLKTGKAEHVPVKRHSSRRHVDGVRCQHTGSQSP